MPAMYSLTKLKTRANQQDCNHRPKGWAGKVQRRAQYVVSRNNSWDVRVSIEYQTVTRELRTALDLVINFSVQSTDLFELNSE